MKFLLAFFLALLSVFALVSSDKPDKCNLASDSGLCQAYIPSFYFNKDKGECEQFIYGGCQGNDNRFQTKEECEKVCK